MVRGNACGKERYWVDTGWCWCEVGFGGAVWCWVTYSGSRWCEMVRAGGSTYMRGGAMVLGGAEW